MEMPNNNNNDRGKYVWDLRAAVEMGTKPNWRVTDLNLFMPKQSQKKVNKDKTKDEIK